LSTVGSKTSEATPAPREAGQLPPVRVPAVIRYLDLVVLLVALPIFILAGFPMTGYAVGAGAWIVQRAVQLVLLGRAARAEDPRTLVGITAASMIGRGWACAIAIFLVGILDSDEAGLAAAVLVIALFTVYFTVQMLVRPLDQVHRPARNARGKAR
jgi:hypothetical protein